MASTSATFPDPSDMETGRADPVVGADGACGEASKPLPAVPLVPGSGSDTEVKVKVDADMIEVGGVCGETLGPFVAPSVSLETDQKESPGKPIRGKSKTGLLAGPPGQPAPHLLGPSVISAPPGGAWLQCLHCRRAVLGSAGQS